MDVSKGPQPALQEQELVAYIWSLLSFLIYLKLVHYNCSGYTYHVKVCVCVFVCVELTRSDLIIPASM